MMLNLTPKLQQQWRDLKLEKNHEFNLLICSLCFLLFLLLLKLFKDNKIKNLPPSPPKLPIIGNLHQLGRYPHRSLQSLSEKYGPLMFLHLGWTPTLVVSSADMAKEVMKSHDIIFSNRPKSVCAKILLYNYKNLGFSPYGDYWREMKKISVLELLSQRRVNEFQYVREKEVEGLLNKLQKNSSENLSVNLSDLVISTSNNIISRCVFGEKFEDEDGKSRYGELTRKLAKLAVGFSIGDFYPGLGWFDNLTGLIGQLKETAQAFDKFLEQVISKHKENKRERKRDFVDILLQIQNNDNLDFKLSHQSLKALLLEMLVAGTETTTSLLEWTIAELVRNPIVMKKVQEEIRRVVGKKSKIDPNDISQMEYLKYVIKESLRIHPPGPLLVPRESSEMVKLGGYCIPPKTRVFINAWAIQRDPQIWENPDEFIPERFMNNPVDFKGEDYHYIPFGGGRRTCPGINFAIASTEYVLANLLQWFDWKLPDKNMKARDLDMTEDIGLAVNKKHPLVLKPIPYSI